VKLNAKCLIIVVLLCSSTIPPAYGLEDSDPYYKECYGYSGLMGVFEKQSKIIEYVTFSADFANFVDSKRPKTQKQKMELKKLVAEGDKLNKSVRVYGTDMGCESLTVDQWLSIREQRLSLIKTAEEYIVKMMQKYQFTEIKCYQKGIMQRVKGINPVCPKGSKQI
jgi:hypothetical protein